ncbi:MAG: hypothetical protein VYD01_03555, partial [Pseudomonadota bacterium]|nr:hypothetical protein [Pseudomonadota bacterium]
MEPQQPQQGQANLPIDVPEDNTASTAPVSKGVTPAPPLHPGNGKNQAHRLLLFDDYSVDDARALRSSLEI